MDAFLLALILATFLCSLVAGFLFAFAVVAMPGIGRLPDREFLRAFQVMDGIIQQNQPLFLLVWVGSVVALVTSAVLGIGQLDGAARLFIVCAALTYLVGVQLPTITINVPLNNRLQTMEVETMDDAAAQAAREALVPAGTDGTALGRPSRAWYLPCWSSYCPDFKRRGTGHIGPST